MRKYLILFALLPTLLLAQGRAGGKPSAPDKAKLDSLLFVNLVSTDDFPATVSSASPTADQLEKTAERNIYKVKGDTFQVRSLTSDYYVRFTSKATTPIFGTKYPVESAINLLLGYVHARQTKVALTHFQYGQRQQAAIIPLGVLLHQLGHDARAYCGVTSATAENISLVLVFHHPKGNYIHLLTFDFSPSELFETEGTLNAKLRSNIPQHNLKSIL